MVKQSKKIFSLFLLIIICSLYACSADDGSGYIFKYDIIGNPATLDPQKATGETAALVIENLFDGLLKLDGNGNIAPSVAGEYSVSEDGLVYKFYLREDVFWTNKDGFSAQCTAADFVFGFARLFNPAVKSQNAEDFFCIKNSQKVNGGQIADIYEIGVKAVGDFELEIELDYPNPVFLTLLTTPPAMPCSEEFYIQSDGRYGLVAEGTPSNGAFYLEKWSYDKYSSNNNNMILRRNNKNSEQDRVYPYGINFFIDEEDTLTNFKEEDSDSIVLSGEKGISLINEGYPHDDYENSVWGIVFNLQGKLNDKDVRYGMASAVNRERLMTVVTGYRITDKIIPDIVKLGDIPYRALADPESVMPYSPELAKERFISGKPPTEVLTLIMPQNEVVEEFISYITQQWQSELGFFCNIKAMSEDDFNRALMNKKYDFAVVKLTADYNSPSALLSVFTGTAANFSNYYDSGYSGLIQKAERAFDSADSAELYCEAENKLLADAVFIPVCYQTEYFIYSRNCSDIIYNPFKRTIDYKEAKYVK